MVFQLYGFGHRDGQLSQALFNFPRGISFSTPNMLYVADQSNHRIRLITFFE